jgi:hypothetical protein
MLTDDPLCTVYNAVQRVLMGRSASDMNVPETAAAGGRRMLSVGGSNNGSACMVPKSE